MATGARSTTQMQLPPGKIRPGDHVYLGIGNRCPEWLPVTAVDSFEITVTHPETGGPVVVDDRPTYIVERADEPAHEPAHQHVYTLTHHAGIDGRGVLGVFHHHAGAQVTAVNDARTRLAMGLGGAEKLAWRTDAEAGTWTAVTTGGTYQIARTPVVVEIPAVTTVEQARVDYITSLVREDLVDIDVFSDADQAAIRETLAAVVDEPASA